ncbi:CHAT domain-containing protein [Plantactinospora sp. KBS50]|uniref:CHAT domain-containing protein n=1 Tax=Plantactinospora sp. KBS50 TaxID=2024580 RepID=UPI000BAACB8B|nr:CHAT domain-containing protein [Plantactinospora sp. KBS50]ASW55886.1 hypothetical protein CIK06_19480 [Plantactinospora sp. KBS50]
MLLERGRAAEAVELLRDRLAGLIGHLDPDERLPSGLTVLLRAAVRVGDRQLADEMAAAVVQLDDQLLPLRLAGASEQQARRLFGAYAERTATVLGHCLPPHPAGEAPSWLYELVLRRKGVLAERQGSAWLRARQGAGVDPGLLDAVRELRRQVAVLDIGGVEGASIQAARREREVVERRLEEAETELYRAVAMAGARAGTQPGPAAPVEVGRLRGALGPQTVLIDLSTMYRPDGTLRYVAFFVHGAGGTVRYRDLGATAEVNGRLHTLIDGLAVPGAAGQGLPELVGPDDPLAPRIMVSPTGVWGMLPMCLLPGPDGRPLIDGHVVSSVPSARSVMHRAGGADIAGGADGAGGVRRAGDAVVLGDPDFDLDFGEQISFFLRSSYPRLPHTGAEAVEVAGRLGVAPVLRQTATRGALLGVHRPRVLHIASHGIFLDAINSRIEAAEPRVSVIRNVGGTAVTQDEVWAGQVGPVGAVGQVGAAGPAAEHRRRVRWLHTIGPAAQLSRSALLLAGCNAWLAGVATAGAVGTGILPASEFALLDLAGTELVVLSACSTGVGAVDYADGSLLGLRGAALAAGAACCVSSLWAVDDAATAGMMSTFYAQLDEGRDPAAALRQAQLALRASHPDPHHWAGWVAEGLSAV